MKRKKYKIDACEIAESGSNRYHLRYRSNDEAAPVLLFVHGGPGSCDRPLVIRHLSQLADDFTVVCWDQRGAGKGYDFKLSPKEKMTLDSCVEDAHAVVTFLKKRFSQDKVCIVGHSWGSLLGVLLTQRYPEDIETYVGIGQYICGAENERLSYEYTLEEAIKRQDKRAVKALQRMGTPVGGNYAQDRDLILQRNYLRKFGGAIYKAEESIAMYVLKVMLTTREYTPLDYVRYLKGNNYCRKLLYDEMIRVNFMESVKSLNVPVYITQGRHDYNTPSILALRWFDALDAPIKEWFWFEESAHSPDFEEPEQWVGTIRSLLLQQ